MEIKCYGIGTGKISILSKASRDAVKYINTLEGFKGVHILPNDGRCLWLFDTMNNAKIAKNKMEDKGILCGKGIGEVFVEEHYLKK